MKTIICDICGRACELVCTKQHDLSYSVTVRDPHSWGLDIIEVLDEQTDTYRSIDLCPECYSKYANMKRKANLEMQTSINNWFIKNMIPIRTILDSSEVDKDASEDK